MRDVFFKFARKIFDIREGELLRASLMQLNIFLIISTLLIVKPTVNGLFLSEIGIDALPTAFVLIAVFAVIISTIYARLLGRISLNRIIILTLSGSVGMFLLFGCLLRFNLVGGWILYAFYIWVAIFAVLTASQFWILANVVFNAREAKRLFGFIGAGAIAGGIFGGYLTNVLAEWIGSENLLFVAAGLLFLCIPITAFIWEKNVLTTLSKFQRKKRIAKTEYPLSLIRKSPHLIYLASIIGLSVIVARLVDFQFNAIASSKIENPDELTAFFGLWFSNFNVISLLVQLLLTRRIVGTLGVGSSLYFLPVSILIGAICVFFMPELWAVIFIKMSDASLKQSVNKAAVELLALPIPAEIKNQTKTFIDVVVDSIATGISGIILIFLVNGLELSTSFISLMIVGLIGIWLFFVLKVRNSYLQSFKLNVRQVHQDEDGDLDFKDASVVGNLKKALETGSDNQILYTLKKLKTRTDDRFVDNFQLLLQHTSAKVKEEAIRNLYFLKKYDLTAEIEPLIYDPSQNVKIAAFDYLIARSSQDAMSFMETYLSDADDRIRLAALVSLAEESRDNVALKEKFELQKRLNVVYHELGNIPDIERSDFHKIELLRALGIANIPDLYPLIEQLFEDESLEVTTQAILSAGNTMHPHFVPTLIQFLGYSEKMNPARDALVKYGKEIVRVLSEYAHSSDVSTKIVRMIPSVVEHFGIQIAADLLFFLLQYNDSKVRLRALRSLNHLKITYPHLNFYEQAILTYLHQEARLYQDTLSILYVQFRVANQNPTNKKVIEIKTARQELIRLLEIRLDVNLERIFRLLGLKYPPEDVISVFENLQSRASDPDLRANALEYLDNLLDPGLKKVLMPIVETALLDSISEEVIRGLNLKIPNEQACYQLLLEGEDEEVKMTVRKLMGNI